MITPSSSVPLAPYPAASRGWYVVGVLLIAWAVAYLDRQILVLLAPDLRVHLGLRDTELGLLQGLAFALFFAVAGLPLGAMVDRFNRRNLLIVAVLIWSIATFMCGLATNFYELFAARMAVGAGEAALAPAAFSIVADYFKPARRGRAMGVMLAGTALGVGAASLLGGFLLNLLSHYDGVVLPWLGRVENWQAVLFIVSTPGLVLALLLLTIREPVRRELAVTPVVKGGGGIWPYVRAHPGAIGLVFLAFSLNQVMGYSATIWAPIVFMRVHGMSAGDVGVMLGWVLITFNCFPAFIGGYLADRFVQRHPLDGRVRVALVSMPIATAGALMFAVDLPVPITVMAYLGPTFFGAILNGALYGALHDLVPGELRGRIVAAYTLFAVLLSLGLGPSLIAMMTDEVFRDDNMVGVSIAVVGGSAGALGVIITIIALPFVRRTREKVLATVSHD